MIAVTGVRANSRKVGSKSALSKVCTTKLSHSRGSLQDFGQSHLIPPKMQTKLEISRQAELFPSSGFFQPRKVVLFCAIVRVAAK